MDKVTNDKITIKEKISYSLVNLGNIPIMTTTSSFLLIFYTNIVGLSSVSCATMFLIARVFDGINDPFIGLIIDRMPYTKWGKFRPVLVIGTLLCVINFALLWFGPLMLSSFKLGMAYISFMLLGVLFPIMDISLNSMLPVMTMDPKERNTLSSIKGISYMVGAAILTIAAPLIIGDASKKEGYITLISIIAVVVLVFSVLGTIGIKERVKAISMKKYGIKTLLKIFRLKPVLIVFISMLIANIGMQMVMAGNVYFFNYNLNNLSLMGITGGFVMVGILPAMLFASALASRFGKKKIYVCGLLISAFAGSIRLISVTNVPIIYAASIIYGFGLGLILTQMYGIQADNTDYVEIQTGLRAEGAVASLSSFITKTAMGIGVALLGYMLAWTGFSAKAYVQPDSVNTAIIFYVIVAPSVLYLIAAMIVGFGYSLTKEKIDDQTEQIKELHSEREQER